MLQTIKHMIEAIFQDKDLNPVFVEIMQQISEDATI